MQPLLHGFFLAVGVVSRIEVTSYAHSSTELLGVQIDAAINSGNSGVLPLSVPYDLRPSPAAALPRTSCALPRPLLHSSALHLLCPSQVAAAQLCPAPPVPFKDCCCIALPGTSCALPRPLLHSMRC